MKFPPAPWISNPEALRNLLERVRPMVAVYATSILSLGLAFTGLSLSGFFFLFFILMPSFLLSLKVICEIAWDTSYKDTWRWLKYRARPDSVLLSVALLSSVILALHVACCFWIYFAALNNEINYISLGLFIFVLPMYLLITIVAVTVLYFPILLLIDALFSLMRIGALKTEAWPQNLPIGTTKHSILEWLTLVGGLCASIPFFMIVLTVNRTETYLPAITAPLKSIFWLGIFLLVFSAIWRIARGTKQLAIKMWHAIVHSKADPPKTRTP